MIATKTKSAHSSNAVRRNTREHVEYEIFYLDDKSNLKRVEVKSRGLRGAVGRAKIDVSRIVDASAKSNGTYKAVKLDVLDRLMGV